MANFDRGRINNEQWLITCKGIPDYELMLMSWRVIVHHDYWMVGSGLFNYGMANGWDSKEPVSRREDEINNAKIIDHV